jgi:hypothetical protein
LSYQWLKDGTNLSDGGNISGAAGLALTLTNVQSADAGSYSVVVTNTSGNVTSALAVLTILVPPSITSQPGNRTNDVGTTATFGVTVTGTSPLSYQWQKEGANLSDGANISGTTSSRLTLTNVQLADAGSYSVVVTNLAGSATSSNALLAVNVPSTNTAVNLIPATRSWKYQSTSTDYSATFYPVA